MANPTDKQSDIVAELREGAAETAEKIECAIETTTEWRAADELERLRARNAAMFQTLLLIAGKFTEAHQAALDRHEGEGTEAFEDMEWVEATILAPIADMAVASALTNSATKETTP
jgi:hypothetical protein